MRKCWRHSPRKVQLGNPGQDVLKYLIGVDRTRCGPERNTSVGLPHCDARHVAVILGSAVSLVEAVVRNVPGRSAGRVAILATISLLAFLLLPVRRVSAAGPYTILDLGTLGGDLSYGLDVNASGQVAGDADNKFNQGSDGFRTRPNAPINSTTDDLGTLTGAQTSVARSINDSGQVVGRAPFSSDNSTYHAFRTTATGGINAAADLGTLGGTSSEAFSVNASGQVVGRSETTVGSYAVRAFPDGRQQCHPSRRRSGDTGRNSGRGNWNQFFRSGGRLLFYRG